MKLWIDDIRPAPEGYRCWEKSVFDAKKTILDYETMYAASGGKKIYKIELIDISEKCDRLLDWLEKTGRNYPIRIHSMNPVSVENMRAIIQRNGWTEIK